MSTAPQVNYFSTEIPRMPDPVERLVANLTADFMMALLSMQLVPDEPGRHKVIDKLKDDLTNEVNQFLKQRDEARS